MKNEKWLPVKGYDNIYAVSNLGRFLNMKKQRLLKITENSRGYLCVTFRKDGKYKQRYAHRIVLQTFHPNENNKLQVNHIDGDKHNNILSNLEWVTGKENIAHAISIGIHNPTYSCSKLSLRDIEKMKTFRNKGMTFVEMAHIFKVSRSTASRAVNGKTYYKVIDKK